MPLKLKSKESNEKVVTIQITWGATQIFFFACEAHVMLFFMAVMENCVFFIAVMADGIEV